jgi:hypothetical protein
VAGRYQDVGSQIPGAIPISIHPRDIDGGVCCWNVPWSRSSVSCCSTIACEKILASVQMVKIVEGDDENEYLPLSRPPAAAAALVRTDEARFAAFAYVDMMSGTKLVM